MRDKIILIFVFLGLIFSHFYLGLQSIKYNSPTYDEPVHLTAGTIYWKTKDFRFNGAGHPAFAEMWPALGVLIFNPMIPVHHPAWIRHTWQALDQYRFADAFFYKNRVNHEKLLFSGRVIQLALSCLLGVYLVILGLRLGGPLAGFLAGFFWAFSPTMLAHGTLITTDLSFVLFFFIFYSSFMFFNLKYGWLLTGIALGLCLASKYFSLILGPISICLLIYVFIKEKYKFEGVSKLIKSNFKNGLLSLFVAMMVIILIYGFEGLAVFKDGFFSFFSLAQTGRSSYLMGEYRSTGWISYFPIAFLIKTPIPLIVGVLVSGVVIMKKKIAYPVYLTLPPLIYFILVCFSKVQIGHRHIFLIYPFIFIGTAVGLSQLKNKFNSITIVLIFLYGLGAWHTNPRFLSYFNEFVGGGKSGYQYLTDSNVDWGQDLKELSKHLNSEDKKNGIYLGYFGVGDPHAYGIKYINLGSDTIAGHQDDLASISVLPTKFAISVTNLQGTYFQNKDIFKWLNNKQSYERIGDSLFLYDFKNDPQALETLHQLSQIR